MKLKSLELNNFMPYKGQSRVDFPGDDYRNVMVVYGDNMRGKTSLLNAIRWVFYGKAYGRHLREISLDELLNKDAAKSKEYVFSVIIEFTSEDNTYILRRTATKKSYVSEPKRPEDYDVSLNLIKNGSAISADSIEFEINKFAPEQVSRFFLFDGELLQEYETLLIEGSDQGKKIKEAIEQVLGVPTLINGRDEISTLLKKFQKQQNKDLQHISGLEKQAEKQSEWQDKRESAESDIKALKIDLQFVKERKIEISDELDKLDSIYLAKLEIDKLKETINALDSERSELEKKRFLYIKNSWKDFLKPKLSAIYNELKAKEELIYLNLNKYHEFKSKIADLYKTLSERNCPTCGQLIADFNESEVKLRISTLENAISELEMSPNELTNIRAKLTDIESLMQSNNIELLSDCDSQINRKSVEITKNENILEDLKNQIASHDTSSITRMRNERDQLIKEESRIEIAIEDQVKNLNNIKRELDIIQKAIQNIPSVKNNSNTTLVGYTKSLELIFEASINLLREELRNKVANEASKAFHSLSTQKSYKRLEINENYGLSIIDETDSVVTIRSAGAEQIVALSLINGLSKTGRSAGPIVMDTPFGRLDLKHRDNILKFLPNSAGQLILLVHDGEIRRETDLHPIADRIGVTYNIREVSPRHSAIDKVIYE